MNKTILRRKSSTPGVPFGDRTHSAPTSPERQRLSVVVIIFLVSILIPVSFWIGPLRITPYRLLLLALFIPLLIIWLRRGFGRISTPDVLIVSCACWAVLALVVNHGVEITLEASGIILIETITPYFIARRYVRNKSQFLSLINGLVILVIILTPFAIFETVTSRPIILEILGQAFNVFPDMPTRPRFGMYRSQVVFEHPILFGAFCSSILGAAFYINKRPVRPIVRAFRISSLLVASVCSVSTGAVAALVIQIGLITWDRLTRGLHRRWMILAILFVAAYIVVALLSNRTPFHVFVTYLTFSVETAYGRIQIFEWGMNNVRQHPIFGIGLNDWERPAWASSSFDNFWLLVAMRYGIPAFAFLAGAYFVLIYRIGNSWIEDKEVSTYRTGFLITLAGIGIAGCTVAFWNAIYCYLLFILGSAHWMMSGAKEEQSSFQFPVKNPKASDKHGLFPDLK